MSDRHEYSWLVRALGVALAACVLPLATILWFVYRLFFDVYDVAERTVHGWLDALERKVQQMTRRDT